MCHPARGSIFDVPETSFQGSKFRIWAANSSISYFSEIVFQAAKHSNMSSAIQQDDRSDDAQESRIRLRNVQIRAVLSCYKIDFLMFRNRVFSVRNVQIWVVLSSNLVDLVIPRNRFFRLRNGEIFSSLSLKRVVLLMLRNSVFKLQIFQIRVLPSCKRVD